MDENKYYPDYNDNFSDILNKFEFKELPNKEYLYQNSRQLLIRNLISKNTVYDNILMYWSTGVGKCLYIDTPIVMFDGNIKKVQDIKVGDLLMGDDSSPRRVLSLARGTDQMYDIIPDKGDKYTVNKQHILCLKHPYVPKLLNNCVTWFDIKKIRRCKKTFKTNRKAFDFFLNKMSEYKTSESIVEIEVKDYLNLSERTQTDLKGYRVPIEFPNKHIQTDPYIMGYLLCGMVPSKSMPPHVFKYLRKFKNSKQHHNIPLDYKCNSKENRLKLLAGLIDSDGFVVKNGCELEFSQSLERESFIDDVIYICRSLGFACYKTKKRFREWRIRISGHGIDEIPTLRTISKTNVKKDVLMTGIKIKFLKTDTYYGFTLDGNCRFLLGDFTVTHNTCGAISIAEGFKEYMSDMNRRIVVLVKNKNIKNNFYNELISDCTGNAYLDFDTKKELQSSNITKERKTEIHNKLVRKINKTYDFMTYGSFVNSALGIKDSDKVSDKQSRLKPQLTNFNNSVIIIDEVHNVTNNETYTALEKVLKNSYNYRLVLLTATPMYDNPKEIFEITNLLNMNNPALILPTRNDLFREYNNSGFIMQRTESSDLGLIKGNITSVTDFGKKLLKLRLTGKVSYFASNTDTFPQKIDEGNRLLNNLGSMNIVECKMSEYQSSVYKDALRNDTRSFGQSDLNEISYNLESNGNSSNSLFYNSSGASVFAYPKVENLNNPYGKDGFLQFFEKLGLTNFGKSKYKIKPEHINILTSDLSKYSSKFKALLENIKILEDQPGNIFIYSNYVEYNGTELIKQLLMNNGFHEFQNKNHAKSYYQRCFIVYDSSDSPEKRERLRTIYNSPENKDGKYIKIIIGSPIISEGITLKNTRQVHILEPSWNMSRINQIIGRAVRNFSHKDLEKKYRNVHVYKYCSIPNNGPSIDKQKYILSEYKDRSNKEIERLLKEVAFDCFINIHNLDKSLLKHSAECDYNDCEYTCSVKNDKLPSDKSTYNLYIDFFGKFDIEYITSIIKKLFKTYFIWSVDDIIESISRKAQVTNESIFTALNTLIENKTLISDIYNRDGYLIKKDVYIIFNPIDKDINTSIFSKILDFKTNTNKYSLEEFSQSELGSNYKSEKNNSKNKNYNTHTAHLSDEDTAYNKKIIKNNLLYGHFRDKGVDGNLGKDDGKFRIVDLRSSNDNDNDKRKNFTGMVITSKKKEDLINIIEYLKITPKLVLDNQYIGYDKNVDFGKLNKPQLAQIIQTHLEKNRLILR